VFDFPRVRAGGEAVFTRIPMRRRLIQLMATAGAAVILSGCATTSSSAHVRTGFDFSRYRTFEWGAPDAFPLGDARLDRNPTFLDYLHGAVEKQMAARGYEHSVTAPPDLLIHFHASIDHRLDVRGADAQHGYCLDDNCRNGVEEYEAGTLIVDVIDRRTNRLVWRGWSQRSVDGVLEDRDRLVKMIEDGVARMFTSFPAGALRSK
jgi:hypothetical protein